METTNASARITIHDRLTPATDRYRVSCTCGARGEFPQAFAPNVPYNTHAIAWAREHRDTAHTEGRIHGASIYYTFADTAFECSTCGTPPAFGALRNFGRPNMIDARCITDGCGGGSFRARQTKSYAQREHEAIDSGVELVKHLNAEHAYTIPAGAPIERVATIARLASEHNAIHTSYGLECPACGKRVNTDAPGVARILNVGDTMPRTCAECDTGAALIVSNVYLPAEPVSALPVYVGTATPEELQDAVRAALDAPRVGFANDPATAELRDKIADAVWHADRRDAHGSFVAAVAVRDWEDALSRADAPNRERFTSIMAWRRSLPLMPRTATVDECRSCATGTAH